VIDQEVNAAKSTISGDDVWNTLVNGSSIIVAQNKKISEFNPKKDDKAQILASVCGRTGNLRAPTLRVGSTFYVGFSEELYAKIADL